MLFKYLPIERIDVLEKLKIRFSPLMSLNDPFESQPLVDILNEREEFLKQVLNDLHELWDKTDISDKTQENMEILEETKFKLIENIRNKTNLFDVGQEIITHLNDKLGVLSLSRTEENLLMWSHYASEGKGIVIGFDDEHTFFKQPNMRGELTRPIPVVYTNKRRKIISGEDRFYEKLLCEKPRDWSYEEEERLFRTFLTKQDSIIKDSYDMEIILTDLPKEAILSVYLGYRISKINKNKVLLAIKNNEIQCNIFQTKVSINEYKIECDEQLFL